MDEEGFFMHMTIYEHDSRWVEIKHQKDIYMDICAEIWEEAGSD